MPRSRRRHPKKPKGRGPSGRRRSYYDPGAKPKAARLLNRPGAKFTPAPAPVDAVAAEAEFYARESRDRRDVMTSPGL